MTKRIRVVVVHLLPLLSSPFFAACRGESSGTDATNNGDTSGAGATPASGGAGVGGSWGGARTTGVVAGGGSAVAITTGGSGPIVGAGGSSSPMGGSVAAAGATDPTGGMSGSFGGRADDSGGTTGSAGGTTGNSGGTTSNAGGTTGNAGGTTSSAGGTTGSAGGTTGNSGGSPPLVTGGAGGDGGAANSSVECSLPNLPDLDALPRNEKLPDPFTFFDGTPVTTKDQWECRRREIQAMAAKYVYGPYPFEPDETTGTVSGGDVSITCTEDSNTERFSATISGDGDAIALDMGSGIIPENSKMLSLGAGFEGKIESLFGISEMNTNVATGWMVDRVMDVLEQNPGSGHDPGKIVVSGCSGCGKGAFLVGVFSRIPMTVIVESGGGGGAANLRQAEWFRSGGGRAIWQCGEAAPPTIDSLEDSGICGPWVTSAANPLQSEPSRVYNLPIDQHLLLATIAPRYLVHFTNNNGVDSWCTLGGTCEALSAWAAKPVWKALGVPERMGFYMYNAMHCSASGDQIALAEAMFRRAFLGDASANTDVMEIPDDGVQQPVSEWEDMWVDWDREAVLD